MSGISSKAAGGITNKLKYNGNEEQRQEFSDGSGLDLYDFNARTYDQQIGRFIQIDPLSNEGGQEGWNPYHSCFNNPILRNDPTGKYAPIYNRNGDFLGTDDQGLQGKGIVMDESRFKQGMKHEDTMVNSLGAEGLTDKDAAVKLTNHWHGLKNRPDYDGFVTIGEGIAWAKSHVGAKNNPTADNTLYLDASKLDFGKLKSSDMVEGVKANYNLLDFVDLKSSKSVSTTYALGNTQMTLLDANAGTVKLYSDVYDWDYHSKSYKESSLPPTSSKRDALIWAERRRAGINDSHGFNVLMYSTGILRK